jgi:hypothetical protein
VAEVRVRSAVPDSREDPDAAPPTAHPVELNLDPPRLPSSSVVQAALAAPEGSSNPPSGRISVAPEIRATEGSLFPNVEPHMAGANRPYFLLAERLAVERSSAAPKKRVESARVETMSLPPNVETAPPASLSPLPTSATAARARFTMLARELAARYRERFGVELRTDLRSVERLQYYLRERYPDGQVAADDVRDALLHGAALSELIARRFDGEWEDIGPNDVGEWSMFFPPKYRVWPFGRVLRYISMRHKERDLVSYILELEILSRD